MLKPSIFFVFVVAQIISNYIYYYYYSNEEESIESKIVHVDENVNLDKKLRIQRKIVLF